MPSRGRDVRSYLFTVRFWPEEVGDGRVEWRGKVHRVVSGETVHFHDWATMLAFLQETLEPPAPATELKELTDQGAQGDGRIDRA